MSSRYDYVIVGAGSAGCVLAARLSEDPDARVALLEAGGSDQQPEIQIPAAFPALFKSSLDWDLLGEQEPGLDHRRLYCPTSRAARTTSAARTPTTGPAGRCACPTAARASRCCSPKAAVR